MAVAPLGLDPTAVYQAVRARPEPSVDGETIEQYLGADGLVKRGRGLVVWIDGDICGFIADRPKAAAPTAIGISEPVPLHDLEPAFRRASRALETALALGARGVFDLTTLGVHAAVVGDADVGDAMVRRYIEALDDVTGGDAILHTTERFLTNDCNAEATARELDVHVNTVRHRLHRFEEATGRSLRETEALVEAWWALQRRQLS
jgi:DNA-binding PucR family transcriptional regulator